MINDLDHFNPIRTEVFGGRVNLVGGGGEGGVFQSPPPRFSVFFGKPRVFKFATEVEMNKTYHEKKY